MHLVLTRATPSDLEELMTLQFEAFSGASMHDAMFGPNTPARRSEAKRRALKDMSSDPADCWVKITDVDTGKIVCGGNWKIRPTYVGPMGADDMTVDWWEGEERVMAKRLLDDFMARRRRYSKEACVCMCAPLIIGSV